MGHVRPSTGRDTCGGPVSARPSTAVAHVEYLEHAMPPKKRQSTGPASRRTSPEVVGLRIVGGRFRGRKLLYSGDFRTRPMKDRLREAVFNLVGPAVAGMHAIDLFGGTGALGLEALSRGAARRPSSSNTIPRPT